MNSKPGFFKQAIGTVAVFFCMFLFVMNQINTIAPYRMSYGGQWNRCSKGWCITNDIAFYPRSNLYPADLIAYSAALVGTVLLSIWAINHKVWQLLIWAYILLGFLPIFWVAITFWAGFNYHECNIPSGFYMCQNPSGAIANRALVSALTFVGTIATGFAFLRWLHKA